MTDELVSREAAEPPLGTDESTMEAWNIAAEMETDDIYLKELILRVCANEIKTNFSLSLIGRSLLRDPEFIARGESPGKKRFSI